MNEKTILVTGATGKQGSAVVRHALQRGFAVRAITRNPDSPAAQALKSKGVVVFRGDLEDSATLGQAIDGAQVKHYPRSSSASPRTHQL